MAHFLLKFVRKDREVFPVVIDGSVAQRRQAVPAKKEKCPHIDGHFLRE